MLEIIAIEPTKLCSQYKNLFESINFPETRFEY